MTASEPTPTSTDGIRWTPIHGGYHLKMRDDGMYCIDVVQMMYNWRVVLSDPEHEEYEAGWCYFGHGVDETGTPRTMETARQAAILAVIAWDGYGDPPGYDKKVGA